MARMKKVHAYDLWIKQLKIIFLIDGLNITIYILNYREALGYFFCNYKWAKLTLESLYQDSIKICILTNSIVLKTKLLIYI